MDTKMIIELIGYAGSALVLVSMLMTSVVRLRLINLVGSVVFSGYALAIHSYPTAVMNIALSLVNIYHLIRIFREKKIYSLVKTGFGDPYFSYLLKKFESDILKWFPEFSADDKSADIAYLICCDNAPAGLFLGKDVKPGNMEVILDYATPSYRDTSVGRFLHSYIASEGYESMIFSQRSEGHIPYLEKLGYRKTSDDSYVMDLADYKKQN